MPKGFLPSSDGALRGWALHFSSMISASPESYGLTTEQAAQFTGLYEAFDAALAMCDPGVRNKVSVVAKNAARQAMKEMARSLAMIIKGQTDVTDTQRIELGLAPRSGSATAIPRPVDSPTLSVASVSGFTVSVRLRGTPGRRGRPPGVAGAILLSFIGDQPTAAGDWRFVDTTSDTTVDIAFPSDTPPGTKVWIQAAWVNPTLQRGPASQAISTHLQGGAVALPGREILRAVAA